MSPAELMQRMIEYGADADGIRDRFGNNAELYEMCLREFLAEPNFHTLGDAVKEGDCRRAFEAAHALKGLSGNLGLTAFYNAVSTLVEPLRAGSLENAYEGYEELLELRDCLEKAAAGGHYERFAPAADSLPKPRAWDATEDLKEKIRKRTPRYKPDAYMVRALLIIAAALGLVAFLFCQISINFRNTILTESGRHLAETTDQIRLYVEEQVDNDWNVAFSVGDSICDSNYVDDDPAILKMLQRKQEVWGVSDLMLYTENGYCTYSNGTVGRNDMASDSIDKAREQGRYMSVADSQIFYTVPVFTELCYNGSRIAAISVVQNMKTFLDDMDFTSFGGTAWMYLTDDNGIVISMLSNDAAVPVFNFMAIAEDMDVTPLDDIGAAGGMLGAPRSSAFLMKDGDSTVYTVSVPIDTGVSPLRLFYLAPEAAVNSTMNGFSKKLTMFSMMMILLFAVLAFLVFLFIYRDRKKSFDKELSARERMFDLLVGNTRTAFGLFNVNDPKPVYISRNAPEVLGDLFWTVDRTDSGYRLRSDSGADSSTLRQANEMLGGWDAKAPFRSGYIRNSHAVPPYYFDIQLYPVDGEGNSLVGIAQDVTDTYEREEATKAAMEMANRSNEAKSRFLSNMSHDIRTPMNAIMNMTNFALESIDQPKKLGPYLHTIRESSEHLLHLINDVLDMSRIESDQTVVAAAPFDIKAELMRQVDMARPLCEAKGQTLITDFSGLHRTAVLGDALKLAQVIMNLLSNAVKFTPNKGAVRFTACDIPSLRSDIVDVRFMVEDNGMGISQEDMARIFEPFCRANSREVNRIEGTGLGLSICKSYVEAMGGTIRCESEIGEGSTFTVELFFRDAEQIDAEHTRTQDAGAAKFPFLGLRCLVVEDNPINQMIAKSLLERLGFLVDFAEDGSEGAKAFISAKPGTYDVIYMDIQMPVLDGYQATHKIRTSGHPQSGSIPIVAMTANVFAEDIEKARAAGMDAYLSKPILSFDLIEQTNKAIRKNGGQKA